MHIKDDILAPNGGGGGTPSPEKKYKNWYIPVISNNSNIKKFRNSQSINYQDLSINLKEVNIDLDYSKVTADYLKYKVNMILPEQINSPYQLLYGNKNPLDSQGNVINSKNVQRVFLDPSKFELEKQYEQGFLDRYIEDNYGKEWKIISKPKTYVCTVPMDVPYWSQGSGVAKDHYVNVNEFIPARFQKWIQYNKASNWKAVNEVFENKFRAITKELWYNNGNAQVIFAWLFTIWSHGAALPTLLLPHYYHTIEIRTIEFWIERDQETVIAGYPEITKQLFKNNFILDYSSWKDVANAIGKIRPFNFKINKREKLIIKGIFFPQVIEINNIGFLIPNVKNLSQLHIKYID